MPEPKQFLVSWTYVAEADTPRAAAAQALAVQRNTSSLAVAFDVQAADGTAREQVTVDLYVSAIECRHTIPGIVYPAQTNGDDEHDWVERCDTCAIYDNDEQAAAAVVAYHHDRGISMVVGHARPFGVDHDCPYVEPFYATARPALPQALVIARLEAAGWHEVAADLRAGQPAHVVLARLAEDPDCRDAALLLSRVRGGFELLSEAQNIAADHGYGALAYVHDAANWPRNVCLGVYHGPDRAAD